ncbi:MAG: CD3324 family protein [Defluviitaleaceae bacterium]|nr:CD3324 family protein [Defluviitaleaceae bacterium]
MRYVNAQDIFPEDILALMQEYTDGAYIYIPRKTRKQWGENTASKTKTRERNKEIYARYQSGKKVTELAIEYFLSEKSIQGIITKEKKLNLVSE